MKHEVLEDDWTNNDDWLKSYNLNRAAEIEKQDDGGEDIVDVEDVDDEDVEVTQVNPTNPEDEEESDVGGESSFSFQSWSIEKRNIYSYFILQTYIWEKVKKE